MDNAKLKVIGNRITKIRGGRSKRQFAKSIGMSGQYLKDIEDGKYCLSTEKVMSLCEQEHISSDYLLFGKRTDIDKNIQELISQIEKDKLYKTFEILEKTIQILKEL